MTLMMKPCQDPVRWGQCCSCDKPAFPQNLPFLTWPRTPASQDRGPDAFRSQVPHLSRLLGCPRT